MCPHVYNNPLRYTDPSGHGPCLTAGIGGESFCGGTVGGGSTNLEIVESLQRGNAVANVALAWPASLAAQSITVGRVESLVPIVEGPLNEIRFFPDGSFTQGPSSLARASSALSYGLPVITGALNQFEIKARLEAGLINSDDAIQQTASNMIFTTGASGAAGYVIPALSTASAVSIGPGGLALLGVALGYDLTVAQGTVNNLIEGRDIADAFYNARATANDRFTFGHGDGLERQLDRAAAVVADWFIAVFTPGR